MKVILRGTVLKRYLSLRTLIAKVVSLIGYNAFRFLRSVYRKNFKSAQLSPYGKHQDSRENKTNCFRPDLTLSLYYYICKFGLSILHSGIRCIFDKANPSVINVFVF